MSHSFDWGERLPTLAAERVSLRWLTAADVPDLYAVFSDPEVMRYWSTVPFANLAEAEDYLRSIHDLFAQRSLFQWGIAHAADARVIGTCTLYRLDHAHRRAEIGFALARAYWGRGLAREALRALLAFVFEELDLHRLEADADPRNERSLRLLESQGFRREGILRERYHVGGEVQDSIYLGLLRREWTPPMHST